MTVLSDYPPAKEFSGSRTVLADVFSLPGLRCQSLSKHTVPSEEPFPSVWLPESKKGIKRRQCKLKCYGCYIIYL